MDKHICLSNEILQEIFPLKNKIQEEISEISLLIDKETNYILGKSNRRIKPSIINAIEKINKSWCLKKFIFRSPELKNIYNEFDKLSFERNTIYLREHEIIRPFIISPSALFVYCINRFFFELLIMNKETVNRYTTSQL